MYRVVAGACALAAGYVALHHPIAPGLLFLAACLWALAAWRWPLAWLVAVPALLPLLNFLPWTGWIAVDESDVFILATAAGANFRLASAGRRILWSDLPWRWFAATLFFWSLGFLRGVIDAGGFQFDWFGGYRNAANSVRVFKSIILAVVLIPSLADIFRREPDRAARALATGIAVGLGLVALAAIRERANFPGLLDFSTPYRAAATFWEMHIGGAALDGYLALTAPFAAWAVLEANGRLQWVGAALLAVATGYACLTTFSRGVYLAVPFGLAIVAWLRLRSQPVHRVESGLPRRTRVAIAIAFFVLAQVGFSVAGYHGALLLLATAVGMMAANALRKRPWWPARLRTQGGMVVAMALAIEVVAVINGGSFLMERLAQGNQDFGGRLDHWRRGLALLDGPGDWLLGKGLGRLPDAYARVEGGYEMPADFRFRRDGDNGYAWLSGPPASDTLAGWFGMAQTIPAVAAAGYVAEFDVRAFAETTLGIMVCRKYLIYVAGCASNEVLVPAAAGWQHLEVRLKGEQSVSGPWYLAQRPVFSVSVLGAGRTVAIDNLQLIADGRQLLQNGDFTQGGARWYLSGGPYFLPWHVDNLALELLIDQGLLGLACFMVLAAVALHRLLVGPARRHVLAPFVAAAIGGYLAVGLFSSLMDVPRVASLFFVLVATAWLLSDTVSRDA